MAQIILTQSINKQEQATMAAQPAPYDVQLRNGRGYNKTAYHPRARPHANNTPSLRRQPRRPCKLIQRSRISKKWPTGLSNRPSRGIRRPQHTCYRRAMMQALVHIPEFLNFLNLGHRDCDDEQCPLCMMIKFAIKYWTSYTSSAEEPQQEGLDNPHASNGNIPAGLDQPTNQDAVDTAAEQFDTAYRSWADLSLEANSAWPDDLGDPDEQQDCLDFLESLVKLGIPMPALEINHSTDRQKSLQALLRRLFGLKLSTSVVYDCGCIKEQEFGPETTHIALPVSLMDHPENQDLSLDDAIRAQYRRPQGQVCHHNDAVIADVDEIVQAPSILPIQLRRLRWKDGVEGSRYERSSHRISAPQVLDLTPYTHNKQRLRYRLRASVLWKGRSDFQAGHYKAKVIGPDGAVRLIDDREVTAHQSFDKACNEAYILMYTRM